MPRNYEPYKTTLASAEADIARERAIAEAEELTRTVGEAADEFLNPPGARVGTIIRGVDRRYVFFDRAGAKFAAEYHIDAATGRVSFGELFEVEFVVKAQGTKPAAKAADSTAQAATDANSPYAVTGDQLAAAASRRRTMNSQEWRAFQDAERRRRNNAERFERGG